MILQTRFFARVLVISAFICFVQMPAIQILPAEPAVEQRLPKLKVEHHLTLAPGEGNPRNSEGDFIQLMDGRLLFIYTHFTEGEADHAGAFLASRESRDGGRNWSKVDEQVVPNEGGFNVMSVSLLRLKSGEIALFYLRKNSMEDCRPILRISRDEGESWSKPIECIPEKIGYYVLNNDRVIQLANGRLIMPTALHGSVNGRLQPGAIVTHLSDDNGKTWKRSESILETDGEGERISFMEPGVVELGDGRLLMVIRTRMGCQYWSESKDHGDTWSPPRASDIFSPESPATLTKIPSTGDLLLIWNDHTGKPEEYRRSRPPIRTPLVAAISQDEGKTWEKKMLIEDKPGHGYCYTAVCFVENRVLLGYCAHNSPWGLQTTQISSFPLEELYQ